MKIITEAILRDELKNSDICRYYVPAGQMLSPAAREYLQQKKITICKASASVMVKTKPVSEKISDEALPSERKYKDYETGALYIEKPEYMTQIEGNMLVAKNHPRILFRGKLDSLQALIVLAQARLNENNVHGKLIEELEELLVLLREIMRCDALGEPLYVEKIIGLTSAELRERSHAPMKFFHVQYMRLPDYKMGVAYALLNQIRAAVREAEIAAVNAFKDGRHYERQDILEILNRLSSAIHIMMCIYLEEKKL